MTGGRKLDKLEEKNKSSHLLEEYHEDLALIQTAIIEMKNKNAIEFGPPLMDKQGIDQTEKGSNKGLQKYQIHHVGKHYYLVDNSKQIGEGQFGAPKLSYRIKNSNPLEFYPDTYVFKYVQKSIDTVNSQLKLEMQAEAKMEIENEGGLSKKLYKEAEYYKESTDHFEKGFYFTPLCKGDILYKNKEEKDQDLSGDTIKLNFDSKSADEMIDAALKLSEQLFIMHTSIPNRGPATIWGDLSPNNILFERNVEKKKMDVHLIDFGTARPVKSLDQKEKPSGITGTLCYLSPEEMQLKAGRVKIPDPVKTIGSDIWSSAGIFVTLNNNAQNAFKEKFMAPIRSAIARTAKSQEFYYLENEEKFEEAYKNLTDQKNESPTYSVILYKDSKDEYHAKLPKLYGERNFDIQFTKEEEKLLNEPGSQEKILRLIIEKTVIEQANGQNNFKLNFEDKQAETRVKLNLAGFFEGEVYKEWGWAKPYYEHLIDKMQSQDYLDRPTPLESYMFHSIMNYAKNKEIKANYAQALDVLSTSGIDKKDQNMQMFEKITMDLLTKIHAYYTVADHHQAQLNQLWALSTEFFNQQNPKLTLAKLAILASQNLMISKVVVTPENADVILNGYKAYSSNPDALVGFIQMNALPRLFDEKEMVKSPLCSIQSLLYKECAFIIKKLGETNKQSPEIIQTYQEKLKDISLLINSFLKIDKNKPELAEFEMLVQAMNSEVAQGDVMSHTGRLGRFKQGLFGSPKTQWTALSDIQKKINEFKKEIEIDKGLHQ